MTPQFSMVDTPSTVAGTWITGLTLAKSTSSTVLAREGPSPWVTASIQGRYLDASRKASVSVMGRAAPRRVMARYFTPTWGNWKLPMLSIRVP